MGSYFGATDYVMVGLILGISAMIGGYYRMTGGKQRTNEEYLMANKSMLVFPVACSVMASALSAVSVLGLPNEIYIYGTQFVLLFISEIFVILIVSYLYLPVFFRLQKISIFEYLEMRFGRIARLVLSGSFILQRLLYMCVAIYAPAIALSATTGFSVTYSILSVGLVCTFYSTVGGMKAVLWTDVFQVFLMITTILTVNIKGAEETSEWKEIWGVAVTGRRINFFNFNPDPTLRLSFWSLMIGGMTLYLTLYMVNQIQIQRLLTVNSLKKSQLALLLSYPISIVVTFGSSFMGLVFFYKYHDCDPLLSKRIKKADQLLLIFVMDYLSHIPGLAGLLTSGVLSATLSTVSSTINSLAAVTVEDFLKPLLKDTLKSDKTLSLITKALAGSFGILSVAITSAMGEVTGLIQMGGSIFGMFGGPTLGMFTLGIFWPRSTQRGVLLSFVTGLAFLLWIGFGAHIQKPYNPVLPRSLQGCPALNNGTDLNNVSFTVISEKSLTVPGKNYPVAFSNSTTLISEVPMSNPHERNNNILVLYRISFMWYSAIGFLIVMICGMLTSLCEQKRPVNSNLLSPLCKYWYSNIIRFEPGDSRPIADNATKPDHETTYNLVSFSSRVSPSEHANDTKM